MASNEVENFSWKIGHPLPKIKGHTEKKLEVIESYLQVYFDTVVRDPRMDNLNITIVDGFAGGGIYDKNGTIRDGSPFVILNTVFDATIRLNHGREKPVSISAQYHFGDAKKDHFEFLKKEVLASQYAPMVGINLHLHQRKFTDLLPLLLKDIRSRQRQGRSIFILDQFGYKDVPMDCIRQIFDQLPKAEVILTFSIDALMNYLNGESSDRPNVRQFGVNDEFLDLWLKTKGNGSAGRVFAQTALMSQLHKYSGARFFTPFMMFSSTDKRHMMVAHLSQSQTARDKMLSVHWSFQNTFKHIGKGSLFQLGFDARVVQDNTLFSFSDQDRDIMRRELEVELPKKLHELAGEERISFSSFLQFIGNNTAGTNTDLAQTMQRLSESREIEVSDENGKARRDGSLIRHTDMLKLSRQMTLFGPKSPLPKF